MHGNNPNSTQATNDPALSNSLTDLAARIRGFHEAAAEGLRRSVENAIAAGELLIEAKGLLKHGTWLPWLRDNVNISERTAQVYMRCAKSRAEIEEAAKSAATADLTLNETVAMLMLSSDVRKLLEMVKTMEGLQGEELVSYCIANDIGVMQGNIFNAPEPTAQEEVEWLVFVLWLVKNNSWYVEGAFLHTDWVQSRGTLLVDWMKPNPIRDAWMPIPQKTIDDWHTFLEANRSRSLDDINAELKALEKVQGPMPLPDTRKRAKGGRRRAN
jgi:Protein of unknown function (DUF3102)